MRKLALLGVAAAVVLGFGNGMGRLTIDLLRFAGR
jgi:hypothetical protein